jgi:hypothetical protein
MTIMRTEVANALARYERLFQSVRNRQFQVSMMMFCRDVDPRMVEYIRNLLIRIEYVNYMKMSGLEDFEVNKLVKRIEAESKILESIRNALDAVLA